MFYSTNQVCYYILMRLISSHILSLKNKENMRNFSTHDNYLKYIPMLSHKLQ